MARAGPATRLRRRSSAITRAATVATARLGDQVNPDKRSSGSQFFINVKDNGFLNGGYTVFGNVIAGMDVADKIANVARDERDNPNDRWR